MNPSLGNILMQTGSQLMQPPAMQPPQMQPGQAAQVPQAPQMPPQQAMQLIAQLTQQVQSEEELLDKLAASGAPPNTSMVPPVQYPQTMRAQGPANAVPVGLPKIPQTRGEAQTNPSLGSYLV